MPFGVMRFKKLHATWVSTVGTNGRSMATQPRSAVAHAIGISGQRISARTAQPQVACSNSCWTECQSMPSRLGIAIASASRMPASIPMFTRLRRFTLSGATSSVAGRGRDRGAELLEHLAEVLHARRRHRVGARRVGSTGSRRRRVPGRAS